MRIRMTEARERRLKQAKEAMDESTKAKTIDRALSHYLADLRNKQNVADDLPTEFVDELSTPYLPIERETSVGECERRP